MAITRRTMIVALGLAAFAWGSAAPAQAQETLKLGLPAIPPVFVTVQAFVAVQEKLFEKYGVKVELRQFDSGANAARATLAGDVDFAISPTPLIVNMISNANADLVGLYGYPHPDWLLASMDPTKKCEDVKGQPVGVDSEGGARSIALNQLIRSCGLTAKDTQQVALSSNVGTAMASGQLNWGVLHIDDVPVIERESGKKVTSVVDINKVTINHYMTLTTKQETAAKKRDALVRALAALMEATKFINDPKNADAVARAAEPTGRSPEDAKTSTKMYIAMEFWPLSGSGLDKKTIDAVIDTQKKVGGIRPDKTPVTYERYVSLGIYEDALKLMQSKSN